MCIIIIIIDQAARDGEFSYTTICRNYSGRHFCGWKFDKFLTLQTFCEKKTITLKKISI